ncbi:type VI secretion system protein TssA [Rubrivirga sp.]|uniref:type VI secretion system protein TssA n=1 Tax=Rubrivirga sp. TaxID=1885344 RepID=UPI003B52F768
MTDSLDSLPAALAAPIPGPAPTGEDVTYDPVFERLRETVDRIDSVGTGVDHESVTGGGSPFAGGASADHDAVVADALAVLTEQSKDVRAAAYLVTSLAHTEGARGVAAGLSGLVEMAQTHWAGLHPPRARARRGAFEFLAARVSAALATWDRPAADERGPLDAALAAVADLQLLVSAEMGDDAPALSGLRRALSDRLRTVPDEARPPPPAEEPAPSASPSPTASGDGSATASVPPPAPAAAPTPAPRPTAPSGPPTAVAFTGDPVRAVVQAAAAFRSVEAASASAIRLVRVVRWDPLVGPPPATDHATMIEPPPDRRREALVTLAASDPALFVEQAEQALADTSFHFWLDLQRLADGALAELGPVGAEGRSALRAEVARLVGRVPALLDLRFRDGTPFADDATRAWAGGLSPSAPSAARPRASDASSDDAGSGGWDEARSLVESGDLAGALAALERAAPSGGRAGLVHRLRTAELCLSAGRADVAQALVTALVRVADGRDLDTWEPGLAADLYAALATAARQAGQADAAAQAHARLAAVAPSRAVTNG